jgi:hypothetical protein
MIRKGPRKSKKSVSRRERRDAERKDRNIGMMEKEEYRRQENGKGRKIGMMEWWMDGRMGKEAGFVRTKPCRGRPQ